MLNLVLAAALIAYPATVVKAVDGDTIKVNIADWPAPFTPIDIRIKGVDTPEHVKPPAKKLCEVKKGVAAMLFARTLVAAGDHVTITWLVGDHDKYGRLLGAVTLPDGSDWGTKMIAGGYARAYGVTTGPGALTKKPWC